MLALALISEEFRALELLSLFAKAISPFTCGKSTGYCKLQLHARSFSMQSYGMVCPPTQDSFCIASPFIHLGRGDYVLEMHSQTLQAMYRVF